MAKPLDLSKFRKGITKTISGISTGFNDPDTWISTGSYALNYLISGDFYRGVPMGKVTVFAGESGSGKSFLASGNIIRGAQEQGIFVVLIDSESALDAGWLTALGVDISEDKLLKLNAAMVDDVAKIISEFVNDYKKDYLDVPKEDRPKVLFVIDSLGMLLTPTETTQFQNGEMKGDLGRKAKQLKALVTNCVNMFGNLNIGMVCTNHSYASQDMFSPDPVISGGSGFVYAASIVVAMKKLNLKEDEEGNKISEVVGIRSVCKVVKSRYSKPFETVKINIPYETGMNPISGLFDLFEKTGKFVKQGNRYKYIKKDGTEMLYYRKEWNDITKMKIVMDEFSQEDLGNTVNVEDNVIDDFDISEYDIIEDSVE
jgi:recombination protein RecA